ncbi:hypothetical protein JZ751_000522 [Albula glossodonta]|uniref:Uncharacterized protein n=1 Tax=Albula glossodonta TaxID=121402 RepID=A0A8T2PWL6_9TELE|nr:hypothetical protein JZ751_000522 [Albula glossodonta]
MVLNSTHRHSSVSSWFPLTPSYKWWGGRGELVVQRTMQPDTDRLENSGSPCAHTPGAGLLWVIHLISERAWLKGLQKREREREGERENELNSLESDVHQLHGSLSRVGLCLLPFQLQDAFLALKSPSGVWSKGVLLCRETETPLKSTVVVQEKELTENSLRVGRGAASGRPGRLLNPDSLPVRPPTRAGLAQRCCTCWGLGLYVLRPLHGSVVTLCSVFNESRPQIPCSWIRDWVEGIDREREGGREEERRVGGKEGLPTRSESLAESTHTLTEREGQRAREGEAAPVSISVPKTHSVL